MKKSTKKTISTIAAVASVTGVVQPVVLAATTNAAVASAKAAVAKVEITKSAVDYSAAKGKVTKLPASKDKSALIAKLTVVSKVIFTADYTVATNRINNIIKNNYSAAYYLANKADINKRVNAVKIKVNRTYLLAQLAKEVDKVDVANYTTALNAVVTAETSKTQADVDAAKAAIEKVTNTIDSASLTARLDKVEVAVTVASVAAITVAATTSGVVPTLPATVDATLSNGTTTAAAITWSDAAKAAATYTTTAAAVTIDGKLADYSDYAVSANVTVNQPVLAVGSVSAINATTVRVELETVQTTAPTADKFAVKVDGSAVAVTAVTKTANTTKSYDLTVATLANKEGSLEVNGKVAAIAGSDFGYDFKAVTVASVVAVDKNHVKVTFSEKVDKTNAELVANYSFTTLDGSTAIGGGSVTPTAATLLEDGKSVLVTLSGTGMINFKSGYIASVLVNGTAADVIKDIKGNVITSASAVIFDGVGTASTVAPVALSSVYDASTTKTITVKFDKAISATVAKAKIKIAGQALALADTAVRDGVDATNRTLKITLSAASATTFEAASSKVVAFEEGAVVDTDANNIAASTVNVVETAKLVSATYGEDTNILVLNFSSPVQTGKLDLTKIEVNGQTLANGTIKETGNSATVTVDLTAATNLVAIESAASTARKVEVKASALKNLDANSNAIAQAAYTTNFTYTDDAVAPTLVSASVNATTKKMVLTFSEPVTNTTANMVEIYDGTTKLFDLSSTTNDVASVTAVKNTLEVVLKTNPNPYGIDTIKAIANKSNLLVKVLKTTTGGTEAIVDAAGNKFSKDADASVSLAYTDQDAAKYVSTAQTGLATNQVKVTFDKAIAAADLTTAKFTVVKKDNTTVTVPVTKVVGADDNRQVILTLDDKSTNFVLGYDYVVQTTAKDIYGNPVETDYINADFNLATQSATPYALTGIAYADTNNDYTANAGDKLTLTFNGAVNLSGDVTADDFVLGGAGSPSLGTNFTVQPGSKPEQVVITLGANAKITLATTTFNITSTADNKHIVGVNGEKVAAAGSAVSIAKIDSLAPTVTKAVYTDTVADGLLGDGDTLTLTFNEDVKLLDGSTLNESDFLVTIGGTTLKLKANQAIVDGKTVTVILDGATNNTIPATSKIDIAVAGTDAIADLWGNTAVAGTAVVVEKSDTVAPKFTSVSYVKADGKTSASVEAGDKIVLQLSEAVGFTADATPDAVFVLYKGVTPVAIALSANNDGSDNKAVVSLSNSGKTLTITLGSANIGAELATTPISTLTSFNVDASKTKTATDANGNLLAPAVGFGLELTK